MVFEITGKVIVKDDVQQITAKFKKREFVIEVANERDEKWNDFIKFQLTQDNVDLIEKIKLYDEVTVSFNVRGRKWEKEGKVNYFSNLDAWRIEKTSDATAKMPEFKTAEELPAGDSDDLPF